MRNLTAKQWEKVGVLGGIALFVLLFVGFFAYVEFVGCDSRGYPPGCIGRMQKLADDTLTRYDREAAERACASEF